MAKRIIIVIIILAVIFGLVFGFHAVRSMYDQKIYKPDVSVHRLPSPPP